MCNREGKRGQPDWKLGLMCKMLEVEGTQDVIREDEEGQSRWKPGLFFMDFSGPITVPSFGGNNYVMIFMDDYSRMKWGGS